MVHLILEIYGRSIWTETLLWFIKDLSRPSDKVLWSTITFVQSCSAFSVRTLLFRIAPKTVCPIYVKLIQHWSVAVCKLPYEAKGGSHANQYPACNYWNYYSVLWSRAYSHTDVEHYWNITGCHFKSPAPGFWVDTHSLTQGSRGHVSFSAHHQGGADQTY